MNQKIFRVINAMLFLCLLFHLTQKENLLSEKYLVAQNVFEVLESNKIKDNDGIQCLLTDGKNLSIVLFDLKF
jgi:hypothetical protein